MEPLTIRNILVPTDFSATCRQALQYATKFATAFGAEICVVHVWSEPTFSEGQLVLTEDSISMPFADWKRNRAKVQMEEFLASVPARTNQTVQLWSGKPSTQILKVATELNADLIVMGSRRRSAIIRTLLGSVADTVVRASDCPVVTIPPVPSDGTEDDDEG